MKALKENINQTKIGEVKPKLKKTFTDLIVPMGIENLYYIENLLEQYLSNDKYFIIIFKHEN